jgi:energy-coupling factor transporter ATP-binding protein EcfA2
MDLFKAVGAPEQYGPLQANFSYDVRSGYTALVGANNAGKSALLQLIFRSLMGDEEAAGPGGIALILPDRDYVQPTTETGGFNLWTWNSQLLSQVGGQPLTYGAAPSGPGRADLTRVLMDGDFISQNLAVNELLERLGLAPFVLKEGQQIHFEEVLVHLQGSGLRGVLPILAALTHPTLQVVLIDEPELSLEPRLQKVLRDLLIEASKDRVIVVATHSHLFVHRDLVEANQVVERSSPNETSVRTLSERSELYDVIFDLLGSSTEDLFFPGNYVIVEGASDQQIVTKVLELLGPPPPTIKVLAARGVDAVRDAVESVYRASVPLVVNDSPYAGRVVALIDKPHDPDSPNLLKLQNDLKDRLYVLDQPSIEEYMPLAIYERANRSREDDLAELERLRRSNRLGRDELKRAISSELAAALSEEDLKAIPIVVDAARRAVEETRKRKDGRSKSRDDQA